MEIHIQKRYTKKKIDPQRPKTPHDSERAEGATRAEARVCS
jgi:hypothetical protein